MANIPASPMLGQTLNGLGYQTAMGDSPYYQNNYLAHQNAAKATTDQFGGDPSMLAAALVQMLLAGGHQGLVNQRNFDVGQYMQSQIPQDIKLPVYLNQKNPELPQGALYDFPQSVFQGLPNMSPRTGRY